MKFDFSELLGEAWSRGMTHKNITSGFRKCGIYSYKLFNFLQRDLSRVRYREMMKTVTRSKKILHQKRMLDFSKDLRKDLTCLTPHTFSGYN